MIFLKSSILEKIVDILWITPEYHRENNINEEFFLMDLEIQNNLRTTQLLKVSRLRFEANLLVSMNLQFIRESTMKISRL